MNTTELIQEWTMNGADRDFDGRFRSVDDIRGILSGGGGSEPTAPTHSLLVRHADDEEWLTLSVGEGAAGAPK